MKKSDKFVLLILLFAAILMAAVIGYRFLADRYTPQELPMTDQSETSSADNTANPEENTPIKVPDFTVYDMNGNTISLYESLDKPVVLNFWATWCGPCQSEMPAFDKMYQKYGEQINFLMVNVTDGSRDTKEKVSSFYEESGYTFPVYLDTNLEASMTYGAGYSIPLTFFIDTEGNLLYSQMGAIPEDTLKQGLELLLNQE